MCRVEMCRVEMCRVESSCVIVCRVESSCVVCRVNCFDSFRFVSSCRVMLSCRVVSCHVMSCHVMSCRVMSQSQWHNSRKSQCHTRSSVHHFRKRLFDRVRHSHCDLRLPIDMTQCQSRKSQSDNRNIRSSATLCCVMC